MQKFTDFDLTTANTFRIKAKCGCYIEYDNPQDLKDLDFDSLPRPIISIGEGSNLLFTKDFPGTVLRSRVSYIKYFDVGADDVPVAVGAGTKWDDFVAKVCADGLWGAENLSLIPGTVGAAAVQNIGAYGVEAKDIIAGVTCFDIQTKDKTAFKVPELQYGYRDSIFKTPEFKNRYIITGVLLKVSRKAKPCLEYKGIQDLKPTSPQEVRDAIIAIRNSKLPRPEETGSAGSFFKNPVISASQFAQVARGYEQVPHYILEGGFIKVPAAWLIEQAGLKGAVVGGAALYEKQPLVIVNQSGSASAQDILDLETKVVWGVQDKFGITLTPEVEHI